MKKIIAFIPARGGSKGIPGKNIKIFAGKPLIVHTINYALESNFIDEVIVSTDDIGIAKISKAAGAIVINRPSELAIDTATTESVIEHYLNHIDDVNIIVLLQPTSPIRPKGSLDHALKHFQKGGYDSLLSICPTHRFFWKIQDNNIAYSKYDYKNRPRRQDINKDDINFIENGSLYIFNYEHFKKTGNRLGGIIGYVEWSEKYSIEIDTNIDFLVAENIYNEYCT